MSRHSLLFDGNLELVGGEADDRSYWFDALTGSSFGEPQPVEVAISSLLRDGALMETESVGNREVSLIVEVHSTDGAGLTSGIAALHRATGKRTTLVWTPPDGYAPPTVFSVETSALMNPGDFDGVAWAQGRQTFRLRLTCLPYGRSVGFLSDEASTPEISGGTVLYGAESTSGWATFGATSSTAPEFTVDSSTFTEGTGSVKSLMTNWAPGRVDVNATGGFYSPAQGTSHDEVTGLSLSTGTGGYLAVAVRGEPTNETTVQKVWTSVSSGVWVEVPATTAIQRESNGFVHYAWPVEAGLTIIGFRFQVYQKPPGQPTNVARPFTWYDDFELLSSATSEKQIIKQLFVKGSARTTGSLHVSSSSDSIALGPVLIITQPTDQIPAGFTPDARRWIVSGDSTADPSAINGSYLSPNVSGAYTISPRLDVPVALLAPGPYTIVVSTMTNGNSVFGVRAQLRPDGTDTGPISEAEVAFPSTSNTWQFITVGTIYLPPLPMESPDEAARVRLTFKGARFSELYMIPASSSGGHSVADFSILDLGTGTVSSSGASSNLWIDSPSADQPRGGLWRGPTSARLNTRSAYPDAKRPGQHSFEPGALTAFVIATNAQGPSLALSYFPSWFGNAAL